MNTSARLCYMLETTLYRLKIITKEEYQEFSIYRLMGAGADYES